MDLRFGEDYNNHFDPSVYLRFYADNSVARVRGFPLRCFHEFWSKQAGRKVRVLDFGGGPTIYDLISAAPYAEEIIFAEYAEKNRQEVEKWRQNALGHFDWLPYFKFVVQNLEGKESEEVVIRESELRKKISHILSCDIALEEPVKWPSSWPPQAAMFDVVSTSLCIEAAVKSLTDFSQAIRKLHNYLKPGGHLVMFSATDENFYRVGNEKFHCFNVTAEQVKDVLWKQGFTELDMRFNVIDADELYERRQFYYFVSAKKL